MIVGELVGTSASVNYSPQSPISLGETKHLKIRHHVGEAQQNIHIRSSFRHINQGIA